MPMPRYPRPILSDDVADAEDRERFDAELERLMPDHDERNRRMHEREAEERAKLYASARLPR